jgi:hypothetical protein
MATKYLLIELVDAKPSFTQSLITKCNRLCILDKSEFDALFDSRTKPKCDMSAEEHGLNLPGCRC